MSKEPNIVRYTRKPLTNEQRAELDKLADLPDDQIDLSDMPEVPDSFFENATQGMMYRALKQQTTLRLDADVLDWFKRHAKGGKGYQTDINMALREHIAGKGKKAV